LFGSYPHDVLKQCEMTRGMEQGVKIPVSRHAQWKLEDFSMLPEGVDVCVTQAHTGPCVIWDPARNYCHMMNHFEYEVDTLDGEYRRDVKKGKSPTGEPIAVPFSYYPNDDPNNPPVHTWEKTGVAFYSNWVTNLAVEKLKHSKL